MRTWMLSAVLILSAVFATPYNALSSDVEDLVADYLNRAEAADTTAHELMARDLLLLTWDQESLEYKLEIADQEIQFLQNKIKREEPSFLDKLGNSSLVKVGLFLLGVKLGTEL